MKLLMVSVLGVLLGLCAGCDWIGDPWVSGQQYEEERSRSDRIHDKLIDRAERGYTDR